MPGRNTPDVISQMPSTKALLLWTPLKQLCEAIGTVLAELGDAPDSEGSESQPGQTETTSSPSVPSNRASTYSPNASADTSGPKSIPTTPESAKPDTDGADKTLQGNNYLHSLKIIITQTPKVEAEIMKEHKILRGLTTQEAETELLSRASQLITYGIDPFPVRPLHKVIIPSATSSTSSTNEAGDQMHTETNASATTNTTTTHGTPVYLPKGTAFYMGITGTGLVTFVGLQRNQEYHWDQIQRVGCDGERFLVYLKKDENKSNVLTFHCESKAAALALWRWTVDRKCFFTLKQASEAKRLRPTSNIFQRSHTYRFSGRSQQELTSIPIRNTKNDFVRRLRPPLELREENRPCEIIEPPAEAVTSAENMKAAVIIPDTVIEQPAEEESATAVISEHKAEENKIVEEDPQPQVIEPEVEEPQIQATQMPPQLTSVEIPKARSESETTVQTVEKKKVEVSFD
ncbi:unnamed protein product [Echinostoma caproni]|uniref:FERM_C domain-containing protein n=1 Tax=Echinostoma caproni TaxID=27848 RepID=A0A183A742_9TREM|nr:unnamed protein product [Echinostoma caproni]